MMKVKQTPVRIQGAKIIALLRFCYGVHFLLANGLTIQRRAVAPAKDKAPCGNKGLLFACTAMGSLLNPNH